MHRRASPDGRGRTAGRARTGKAAGRARTGEGKAAGWARAGEGAPPGRAEPRARPGAGVGKTEGRAQTRAGQSNGQRNEPNTESGGVRGRAAHVGEPGHRAVPNVWASRDTGPCRACGRAGTPGRAAHVGEPGHRAVPHMWASRDTGPCRTCGQSPHAACPSPAPMSPPVASARRSASRHEHRPGTRTSPAGQRAGGLGDRLPRDSARRGQGTAWGRSPRGPRRTAAPVGPGGPHSPRRTHGPPRRRWGDSPPCAGSCSLGVCVGAVVSP